ncbi:MAG: aminoglycoside phosphotransferase family protein [Caldilineaceae bacterium]
MSTIAEIMSGACGIEGVQRLMAEDAIGGVVQSMLQPSAALAACHLRRAKFKPGRKLTAYYDVAIDDPRQADGTTVRLITRPMTVTWTPPGTPHKLATAAGALGAEIQQRGLAEPFAQLICDRPDANLHVQVAPFDPVFPHLARLMDPHYAREALHDCAAPDSHWTVTPIRYRPRQRHVLRYDVQGDAALTSTPPQTLFAKVYADDSRQAFCARNHQIADWLAAASSTVSALRPLAYLPADFTILYAQVDGQPLSAKLENVGETGADAPYHNLAQTGAALHTLHRAPASLTNGLPPLPMDAELKAIKRTCEHIAALLPDVWRQIQSILAQAAAMYATLPQEAPTFVHGDFKADHVLAAGDRLTLIDFDSCALADPAYDIGKFIADLVWWDGDVRSAACERAVDAFLDGYGLSAHEPRWQRARIWQALIGIKMTAHRVRIFDAQWAARTAAAVHNCAAPLFEMSNV